MTLDQIGTHSTTAEYVFPFPSRLVRSFDHSLLALITVVMPTVILATAVRIAFGPHIRDDAYITLVYARHIAAAQGFVFNLGEQVLGTTSPLFALLIAGLARLGIEPATAAVWVGILADAAAIAVLGLLTTRFLNHLGAFFVLLFYALLSPIVTYAVSGMETSLYMLLMLCSLLAYSQRRMGLAGSLSALVVLTRPDGIILAGVLFLHALVTKPKGLLRATIFFVLVLSPWIVFALAYFGSPVPQSIIAKLADDVPDRLLSARNFVSYFVDHNSRWFLPLIPIFVLGVFHSKKDRALVLLLGWATAYTVAFMASNKFLYPNYPFEWYFVPLLTPFAVGAGAGMESLASLPTRFGWQCQEKFRFALAFAAVLIVLTGYGTILKYERIGMGNLIEGREQLYARIADRLHQMGVQEDLVAAYEIGSFGYHYSGPILDLAGIVSPQIVGKNGYEVLSQARPPWIMTYVDMLPLEVANSAWFKQEYKRVYALGSWEGRIGALYRRYAVTDEIPQTATNATLGNSMQLLAINVQRAPLDTQHYALHITLVWKALLKMDQRYTTFVHLRDSTNKLIVQHDGEPQGNEYPTNLWQVGETVVDKHDLLVDRDKIDNNSTLVIGAYETGKVEHFLHWSAPTIAQWPHELRIQVSSLGKNDPD